jgi:hypothetical protein
MVTRDLMSTVINLLSGVRVDEDMLASIQYDVCLLVPSVT